MKQPFAQIYPALSTKDGQNYRLQRIFRNRGTIDSVEGIKKGII